MKKWSSISVGHPHKVCSWICLWMRFFSLWDLPLGKGRQNGSWESQLWEKKRQEWKWMKHGENQLDERTGRWAGKRRLNPESKWFWYSGSDRTTEGTERSAASCYNWERSTGSVLSYNDSLDKTEVRCWFWGRGEETNLAASSQPAASFP